MMDEEKYLKDRIGNVNHFRVPEGYFDNFTSQLMARLPEEKPLVDSGTPKAENRELKVVGGKWLRPMLAAAACLLVAVMSVTVYLNKQQSVASEQELVAMQENGYTDSYFEEAADYAMLDNCDIYAYLASE